MTCALATFGVSGALKEGADAARYLSNVDNPLQCSLDVAGDTVSLQPRKLACTPLSPRLHHGAKVISGRRSR